MHARDVNVASSLFFGIVARNGFYIRHWTGDAFLVLMALSLCNHAYHGEYPNVFLLDTIVSHVIVLGTMKDAMSFPCQYDYMRTYWCCLVYMAIVFYSGLSYLPEWSGAIIHSTVHLSGSIGAYSLQCAYHKKNV